MTLVVTGLTADGDGRRLATTTALGSGSTGPYPGWPYALPLLAATAVVALAAAGVLRLIARRPAVVDAAPAWDLALRHLSAHRVLRGTQLTLGLLLAGVLVVTGGAVRGIATCCSPAEGTAPLPAALGVTLGLLGFAVAVAAAVLALTPAPPLAPPAPDPLERAEAPAVSATVAAPGAATDGPGTAPTTPHPR